MTTAAQLSTLELYDRWAPDYAAAPHNPLMSAEQAEMIRHFPDVEGRRVLDLACGSGRYARLMASRRAAEVIAVDLSPAMLARATSGSRILAEMTELPFRDACFDVVVSGLALGHTPELERWMRETARVLVPGGVLLYSDFHPAATQAGLIRSFKDADGRRHVVPHFSHPVAVQRRAAAAAGLTVRAVSELRAGIEFTEAFPGSEEMYRRWHGVPLALVVRAHR